ncbi:MAG: hypothetical protein GX455_04795 [Phycisphaerae bacterium]|nr:hypothetical protein [Phycisphaerae bacterium]
MTDCIATPLVFSSQKSRSVQADFQGGQLTSDAGSLLLREVDRKLNLIDALSRIKEQQLGLFADRTSCHDFGANQFRVLLSAAAYVLMETLRREGLAGTELQTAQVHTIRLKVLKIGARFVGSWSIWPVGIR